MIPYESDEAIFAVPELRLPRADWRDPRDWRRFWRGGAGRQRACCCALVSCATCIAGLPGTLHITFSNSGKCAAIDGLTFTLMFDGVSAWRATTPDGGGCTINMVFTCFNATNFNLSLQAAGTGFNSIDSSHTCSPLNVVFTMSTHIGGGICPTCNNAGVPYALTGTVTL